MHWSQCHVKRSTSQQLHYSMCKVFIVIVCVLSCFSCVWLFATLWTIAHQSPVSWDSPGKNSGVGSFHHTLEYRKTGGKDVVLFIHVPGGLQSMGSLRVGDDWATSLSPFSSMHWRRKWQPTPVFLSGESHGWRSLVGFRLWGHTQLDTTEVT